MDSDSQSLVKPLFVKRPFKSQKNIIILEYSKTETHCLKIY
ncbi:hypothetical protein LEP1GSC035_1824 [Leptospira noguchii str. 2007001578]|uniref:Uncharacterized protein n=2 Tax=Leptospira noguchii TaxID=28182 RepID=M6YI59_9LEPT|nr:hypothetical protein LEP1GSC035_1824 [Leptospira noguchii str. 2007001578]EMO91521.1 hypothetical protein LEP1GSC024_2656 [Leptospira noguchii str. 2001034031]